MTDLSHPSSEGSSVGLLSPPSMELTDFATAPLTDDTPEPVVRHRGRAARRRFEPARRRRCKLDVVG